MICAAVEALKMKDRRDMDKLCSEYAAIAPLLLQLFHQVTHLIKSHLPCSGRKPQLAAARGRSVDFRV